MGYGPATFDFLIDLADRGKLAAGGAVLELGAQELNLDVTPAQVARFVTRFAPGFGNWESVLGALPGGFTGPLFEAAGLSYVAIDLFEAPRSVVLDLNRDDLPPALRGAFDLVTNFGTTEHVCNQAQAFKLVHDALRPGGVAVHQVPFTGMLNHGLVKYEPKFFIMLAHANGYRVVDWTLSEPSGIETLSDMGGLRGAGHYDGLAVPAGVLSFVLEKTGDAPFAVPTDADPRHLPREMPPELAAAMAVPPVAPVPDGTRVASVPGAAARGGAPVPAARAPAPVVRALAAIERACEAHGLAPDPYALAFARGGADAARWQAAAEGGEVGALDALVREGAGRAVPAATGAVDIALGKALIGTGWGAAAGDGAGLERSWRWLGPAGRASLLVRLDGGGDRRMRTLIHDARPGDAVLSLAAALNGRPLAEQDVRNEGGEWWHQARLPGAEISAAEGVCEIAFHVREGARLSLRHVRIEAA